MLQNQCTSRIRVSRVFVEFTNKPISVWESLAAIMGKFLEQLYFRHFVENAQPVQETSNNSCGVSSKVLSHRLD